MKLFRFLIAGLALAWGAASAADTLVPEKAAAVHISVVADAAAAGVPAGDSATRGRFDSALAAYRGENWANAIAAFRSMAAEIPGAAYNVAVMQLQGLPDTEATAQGLLSLERLAAAGFNPAQTLLGNFYMDGMFVERNYVAARRWLLGAGVANPRALLTLGELLEFGLGGSQDLHAAKAIYQEIAGDASGLAGRYAERVARKIDGVGPGNRPTRMGT